MVAHEVDRLQCVKKFLLKKHMFTEGPGDYLPSPAGVQGCVKKEGSGIVNCPGRPSCFTKDDHA
jgi:hypothetical protein